MLEESCAHSEVTTQHLGEGLSSAEEFKDSVMYIPLGGTQ